jgi:nucleotide-binding universal stress UspA family protein
LGAADLAAVRFPIRSAQRKETAVFENVLVGVEGRTGGHDAIALAQRLVDESGRLTLVHVRSGLLHPLRAVTPALAAEQSEDSERLLAAERDEAGVQAELVSVLAGRPGAGLHEQAEAQAADLIVVGSSSRGLVGRAMLGNDTRAALNGAPCAVAIAARGYAEHPFPLAKIGVAYNGSAEAEEALATARRLAAPDRAELSALEVVSIPSYAFTGLVPPAFGETVDIMLDEANERMGALDGVSARAVYGLPGEELALFSDELDLLIVGSRGYGPVRRLVLGSTSEYLERHARSSVLVLPRNGSPSAREPAA